jgi:hypothetical protein
LRTRNPVSPRRRRTQSRLQKALRYYPQLCHFAETTTPTSVDDLQPASHFSRRPSAYAYHPSLP